MHWKQSSYRPFRLPSNQGTLQTVVIFTLLTLFFVAPGTLAQERILDPGGSNESKLLSNIRQLTFDGKRSGEGYFSPDGLQIIFQRSLTPTTRRRKIARETRCSRSQGQTININKQN